MSGVFNKIVKGVRLYRQRRTLPLRLEINLTQACNLNCRGCTHYSPLAPTDDAESIETINRVVSHLSKIKGINEVGSIYLIGGETLLYPHLEEAITIVRSNFPVTPIHIFTNGIMLPRMKDSFWQACQQHHIAIDITRYPINIDYDSLINLVKSKGVKVHEFADRNNDYSFFRFPLDPAKSQSARKAHFTCFNYGCLSIIGDRLYPCSISGCVALLNNHHGTDFKHEDGDWINIMDITDIKQIYRLRNRPVPFCAYCMKPIPADYGTSRRSVDEWVANGD